MKSLSEQLGDLLQIEHIGLEATVAVAEAIAADARFNIWFLGNVKITKRRPLNRRFTF